MRLCVFVCPSVCPHLCMRRVFSLLNVFFLSSILCVCMCTSTVLSAMKFGVFYIVYTQTVANAVRFVNILLCFRFSFFALRVWVSVCVQFQIGTHTYIYIYIWIKYDTCTYTNTHIYTYFVVLYKAARFFSYVVAENLYFMWHKYHWKMSTDVTNTNMLLLLSLLLWWLLLLLLLLLWSFICFFFFSLFNKLIFYNYHQFRFSMYLSRLDRFCFTSLLMSSFIFWYVFSLFFCCCCSFSYYYFSSNLRFSFKASFNNSCYDADFVILLISGFFGRLFLLLQFWIVGCNVQGKMKCKISTCLWILVKSMKFKSNCFVWKVYLVKRGFF